ncbi:SRPBCC domain-containing protein [Dietzia sp. CH92]|uniref:SRPBCC domain-containing protein n=1 Tax=Dietzia sp. CH92 TaxID=3051823 RepID=UPI0028D7134F|nr:SRPBCC domain-containing protein [Dietzia sp. CH92]
MTDLNIPEYDQSTLVRSIDVEIDAPAGIVWGVLTNLEAYPEWNPFCISARSTLELGAPVEMTLKDFSGGSGTFPNTEYVCAVIPERLLSWELIATDDDPKAARRDQVIEPISGDRCRYYSTDAFLGVEARQIMEESGAWVKRAFDVTALALKQRSESLYADVTATERGAAL